MNISVGHQDLQVSISIELVADMLNTGIIAKLLHSIPISFLTVFIYIMATALFIIIISLSLYFLSKECTCGYTDRQQHQVNTSETFSWYSQFDSS